jgi:hypothetical protein
VWTFFINYSKFLIAFEEDIQNLICDIRSTRYEMADFTVQCKEMGIQYIGICCGAGLHHVRAMAEALGRTVPASKYSPDMSVHPLFGDKNSAKNITSSVLGHHKKGES